MSEATNRPDASLTDAQIYGIADQHSARFRTADEEGMAFDKHAVLDFARAILARSAEAPVASAVGEVIARVVHRTSAQSERIARLEEALRQFIEEKVDYMRINNLGDPEQTHTVKWGRKALEQQ